MSAILACVVYMSATLACVVRFFYLNSSWPQVTGVASTRNRFRMIMCVHSWRGSVESWFYKKLWSNNFRHMSLSLACVVQRWLFNEGDGSSTSSPAVTKVDGLPPASSSGEASVLRKACNKIFLALKFLMKSFVLAARTPGGAV